MEGEVDGLEDWADVAREVEPERLSMSSSSPSEIVEVDSEKARARYMSRRDSTDSVEVMSVNSDDSSSSCKDKIKGEKCPSLVAMYPGLHDGFLPGDATGGEGSSMMLCSGCQSLTSSMVHVKMEEMETQTDPLSGSMTESKSVETEPSSSKSFVRLLDSESSESDEDKPPSTMILSDEDAQTGGESTATQFNCADFFRTYWSSIMVIPTHLIFAVMVLSAAHLSGVVKLNTFDDDAAVMSSPRGRAELTVIRELQSPEWLQQLSVVLDDVSSQLISVDGHVTAVENQLEHFDRNDIGEKSDGKHQFVVDAYRQLIEKQRSAGKLLDKINSVLYNDRQPRSEPSALLDVRLKLVDIAGDFIALSSRLIEVTLANKRRHVNIVKKISSETSANKKKHEAEILSGLVDRVHGSPAGSHIHVIDSKAPSCRRLQRNNREAVANFADFADCFVRSRMIADETAKQLNSSLELRSVVARYRDRALIAERTVSELREELSLLNETIFRHLKRRQEQERQQQQQQPLKSSFLQCFSQCSDMGAFLKLLQDPEHCHTCDLIENILNKFIQLMNRISAALLNKEWSSWSAKRMLDVLGNTLNTLNPLSSSPSLPSQDRPVNSGWTSRLKSQFGSVKTTFSKVYNKVKQNIGRVWPISNTNKSSSCPEGVRQEFDYLSTWLKALQKKDHHDAEELNKLFNKLSALYSKTKKSPSCLGERSMRFLECQREWTGRMMRLFNWPVCSDDLPRDCEANGYVLPWQLNMMESVEMRASNTTEEIIYEEPEPTAAVQIVLLPAAPITKSKPVVTTMITTTTKTTSLWYLERLYAKDDRRVVAAPRRRPSYDYVVNNDDYADQKKKGDDGRIEDVAVKDVAISHEFCYSRNAVSACRYGMSEVMETRLPDSFLSLLKRVHA